MRRTFAHLERGAELIGAAMFAAMFGAFLLQIFMRYVVRQPLGWTTEVCMIAYVWFTFWGCAFLLRDRDHITFNLIYAAVAPGVRRVLAAVSAVMIIAAFAAAVLPTLDFVTYMNRIGTDAMGIPTSLVFVVFPIFLVAAVVRQAVKLARLLGPQWRRQVD